MRNKFLVCYWVERNDESVDLETVIEANNFDEAYKLFKDEFRLAKIESIKLMY